MKVCLMSSYYPPYVGGIERYTSNLAAGLVKRGHNVTVYCSSRPLGPGETIVDGVRVVRFQTPLLFYGAPLGLVPPGLIRENFDVMHCSFPSPYFASISALVSATRKIPAVLTWHNDLPVVRPIASPLVRLHDALSPTYLDVYRYLIATTSEYARNSMTLHRYSRKVRVVLNGVDTGRFRPGLDGNFVAEKYGLKGSKIVLFVGALTRWHSYKGVDLLLEAFALVSRRSSSLRLIVVGGGEMLGAYKSMARDLNVIEKVQFIGQVDDDVLPLFYAACDVAVLPSRDSSEGFGLVLLEAMASGKAVIGTSVGGIPELVQNGRNGILVEPNNPEALGEAILDLCADDEKRSTMGRSGREFALSHSWEDVAGRVESIYKDSIWS